MKTFSYLQPLFILAAMLLLTGFGEDTVNRVKHRFICCDYQGNKVAVISMDGTVEWEFTVTNPQDCWQLPNGNILVCHRNGVKEISMKKEIVHEYNAPKKAMCHSCQPLPGGGVLLAECGMNRLVELDQDFKVRKIIPVSSKPKIISHQFRGTRKTANGHYLVCLMDEKKIVELSADGDLLREIPVEGYPHAAVLLPNGHLLVTLGDAGKVIELDQELKIVWQIGKNEISGNELRLPAGCQRLPNGNTIVCNYLPGGFAGKQPQAFEVTRDKKVVWEFTDHKQFRTMNQIYLLDLSKELNWQKMLR